ncbi:serine/threonine protein kinase [Stigmatella aurantiaca]|uniref:Serine/threonine protein kinase n=1 Tax=Stigmatella aurantiaca TaxID=41 RepID=A0A1H7N8J1_STIAU|nr:serine/threonine-protein kinase [Stigmatella aurantiaca]SEL19217.1 serine/threonine protein kinase [Stigmatella aurantiaca]
MESSNGDIEALSQAGAEMVGRRYHIMNVVGRGGMGTVYQARDRLSGVVALKRLHRSVEEIAHTTLRHPHHASKNTQPDIALGLADEFKVLTSLHHPHVISVLDYGFDDQQRPYYTMDLLTGARTITDAGKNQPHDVRVQLLAQVLQALAYMHRWGVIHRDLKPANVLVVDGQVKVLDFGLALAREGLDQRRTVGSPGFVAPELFEKKAASAASDLYSLGMIAYRLFAMPSGLGKNPGLPADFGESPVGRFLQKLSAPNLHERFASAEEALAALTDATGQQIPTETQATRESFLQGARLVGREREQAWMEQLLDQTLTDRGSAWLIGGESGVGKSRLLDEVRTLPLVRGAVAVRGQAVSSGGSLYHEWRSVLRWLVLWTEPTDHEASVLQPLVEDIEALLGRLVNEAPELEPEAAQGRLFAVVEDLFRRVPCRMVLILEDLQWMHAESLRLLTRIAAMARHLPLLVLGSFRDDERPGLAQELPMMDVIRLPRLRADAIAVLTESMIGPAGRSPQLVEMLQRETEGNPFFLVEVVRALAEETGQLDRIGTTPLPAKVFPGGMQQIIQRRLDKLNSAALDLLRLAAVIGRQIDVKVLRACATPLHVNTWLGECASAAVLELFEGQWRFTHDKLREGVLANLPAFAEPLLHRQAAEAIESVYPEAQDWASALALHWGKAGELEKEARWSQRAGEQALAAYSCLEAIQYLERARTLRKPSEGDALHLSVTQSYALGRIEALLAEATFQLGDTARCCAHAESALLYFDRHAASGEPGWSEGALAQIIQRMALPVLPTAFETGPLEFTRPPIEAGRLLLRLTEIFIYAQDFPRLLWSGMRMLSLYEPLGPSPELARAYALMAVVASSIPQTRHVAEAWLARALEMAESLGTPVDVAFVLARRSVCGMPLGRWQELNGWLQRALALASQLGDFRQVEEACAMLANACFYSGQYVTALELTDQMQTSAHRRGAVQTQHWGAMIRVGPLLRLGRYAQAVASMEPEVSWFETCAGTSERIMAVGSLALAYLRMGNTSRALETAARTLETLHTLKPVAYWLQSGISSIAEVYFTLWEQAAAASSPDQEALAQGARATRRSLDTFSQTFPFALAAAWLCRGMEAFLSGNPSEAHQAWEEALAAARRFSTPYEEGLAHFELGRHLPPQEAARRHHLLQAREIFSVLGAEGDVLRVQKELDRA